MPYGDLHAASPFVATPQRAIDLLLDTLQVRYVPLFFLNQLFFIVKSNYITFWFFVVLMLFETIVKNDPMVIIILRICILYVFTILAFLAVNPKYKVIISYCTVGPRSRDPFYIVTYYIKRVTIPWTYSSIKKNKNIFTKCFFHIHDYNYEYIRF